jgi:hypothetical protein
MIRPAMAELRPGDPPPAPRVPMPSAIALLLLGIGVALAGVALAIKALLSPGSAATFGRTAAGLAGGGVFVAATSAPALKRQTLAREALEAFASERGFERVHADEARGELLGTPVAVRIAYGTGPYKSRGASAILVHVRPGAKDAAWGVDAEPFDERDAVMRHLARFAERAVKKASPGAP